MPTRTWQIWVGVQRVTLGRLVRCGSTPKPAGWSGGEAAVKVRGVAVAMLSGSRWAPPSSIDSVVNVGTIRGRPPTGHPVTVVGRSVAD
jgi:hypothetical protein